MTQLPSRDRRGTTNTQSTNTHPVKTVLTLTLLIFVVGIFIGVKYGPASESARSESTPSLLGQLTSAFCYTSLAILGVLALALIVVGGYYGKLKLDARARVWKAQAEHRETLVERERTQLHDLTPGPDGKELARLVQTPDGRLVLLKPGIATSPVTVVDPDAAVRPDQTSDQLALVAILSQAVQNAAGFPRSGGGGSSDPLLMALMLSRQAMDERVPANVRVLSAEEVKLLEDGRD
jgi:hypothetical protein